MNGRPIAAALVAGLLLVCSACSRPEPVAQFDFLAFSTTVSLSLYEPPDTFVSETLPLLEQRMSELETRWRSFGDGELGLLNAALERGECATPGSATYALTARALELQSLSSGLFDPTLGLEVDALGFRDADVPPGPPAPAVRGNVELGKTAICADGPVRLDLGGVAKGAIVQELAELLARHQIHHAIINVGGDMLVLGSRGPTPWRIAIQHPRRRGVIATFEAHSGEAIFSSGDYRRSRLVDGQTTHHILDPRTGKSAVGAVATTVIHTDPLLADAAATALMVAGPGAFEDIARKLGLKRAVLIDHALRVHALATTNIDLPTQLSEAPDGAP